MKKICILLLVCAMLALAACGGSAPAQEAEVVVEDAAPVEDGQNPVMNFIGVYGGGRPSILVECEGQENAKFTVTWGSSAFESSEWTMSGKLDLDTLTVAYDNCTRIDRVFKEDGSAETETVVYENGTGRVVFDAEHYSLTWEDDQEHMADGMVLEGMVGGEEPEIAPVESDHYSAVTAMPWREVEQFAMTVRENYLAENWEALAELIRYPITINEVELADEGAFLAYMADKTVHESDRTAMDIESCNAMFVNGQGICMGSGQIWLPDPGYMTDAEPVLQIIAISGIVNK